MLVTRGVKATSGCPTSASRIVQFRRRGRVEVRIISANNQHHPVRKHSCRMQKAPDVEAASDSPRTALHLRWRLGNFVTHSSMTLSKCSRHHLDQEKQDDSE